MCAVAVAAIVACASVTSSTTMPVRQLQCVSGQSRSTPDPGRDWTDSDREPMIELANPETEDV